MQQCVSFILKQRPLVHCVFCTYFSGEGIVALYAVPNPFLLNKICLTKGSVLRCYMIQCHTKLLYVMLCHSIWCYIMLCHSIWCYIMLCHSICWYIMLLYVMLRESLRSSSIDGFQSLVINCLILMSPHQFLGPVRTVHLRHINSWWLLIMWYLWRHGHCSYITLIGGDVRWFIAPIAAGH